MFDYLQRICFFMVLAEMLLHLRPARQYERYLKMITGLISLAIVLLPACKLLTALGEGDSERIESLEVFEQKMYDAMKEGEIKIQSELTVQKLMQQKEEGLNETSKEALCERINQAVEKEGYETKELFLKEGVLDIVLKQKEGNGVGKIQIDILDEKEKGLVQNIAKELNTDETNFTVSVE